eukprot:CAMPEP_0174362002 /NCGR_PEP_ID=MMETSP0811_2-20130205/62068_1 /TAXON_ID=73025 ORGANISM="Eutreptiella gymnastica-like, Strain CCMP1594" /NCGR_SAMPLE_ID=MMETSP0811_2 /ASSEMBLY_ACC=CAM_ASM_000667 /LENGTH=103 /DNA_ID=CAMNT_0015499187 /DNA_START=208 /DNA_END=516 /DNA_ORIENTATION=+
MKNGSEDHRQQIREQQIPGRRTTRSKRGIRRANKPPNQTNSAVASPFATRLIPPGDQYLPSDADQTPMAKHYPLSDGHRPAAVLEGDPSCKCGAQLGSGAGVW